MPLTGFPSFEDARTMPLWTSIMPNCSGLILAFISLIQSSTILSFSSDHCARDDTVSVTLSVTKGLQEKR